VVCNRTIHVAKSRHGKGSGSAVGLFFDEHTVRFRELAVLAPEAAPGPAKAAKAAKPPKPALGTPPTPTDADRRGRAVSEPVSAEDLFS